MPIVHTEYEPDPMMLMIMDDPNHYHHQNDMMVKAYATRRGQQQLPHHPVPSKRQPQTLLDPALIMSSNRAYSTSPGGYSSMCTPSDYTPMGSLPDEDSFLSAASSYQRYPSISSASDIPLSEVYAHDIQPQMENLFLADQRHHQGISPSLLPHHDQTTDPTLDTSSIFASSIDSFDPILTTATTAATTPSFFPPLDEQWIPPPPPDYFTDAYTSSLHQRTPHAHPHSHSHTQTHTPIPTPSPIPMIPQTTRTTTSRSTTSTTTTTSTTASTSTPTPSHRDHHREREKEKDLTNYGLPNADGTWRCAYPSCTSQTVFRRGCDLRKHYNRHRKHLFCRHKGCPQAVQGGFSSKKDRDRHETKHNPVVPCEWAGCRRVFSRVDNMKDHVRRIHRRRE